MIHWIFSFAEMCHPHGASDSHLPVKGTFLVGRDAPQEELVLAQSAATSSPERPAAPPSLGCIVLRHRRRREPALPASSLPRCPVGYTAPPCLRQKRSAHLARSFLCPSLAIAPRMLRQWCHGLPTIRLGWLGIMVGPKAPQTQTPTAPSWWVDVRSAFSGVRHEMLCDLLHHYIIFSSNAAVKSQFSSVIVRWLVGIGIKVLTAIMDFDVADRQEEPAMLLRAGQRQTKGYLRGGSRELESA